MAWFQIFGRTRLNQQLLYIDGFAGPGEYTNYPQGSPLAALSAAKLAIELTGRAWIAEGIHCAFIEEDLARFKNLVSKIDSIEKSPRIVISTYNEAFVDGLKQLRSDLPTPFKGSHPLFAFIDPFGATGGPFEVVADLLNSPSSEVLVNLDADGIARIFKAEELADYETNLTSIFGDDEWRRMLSRNDQFDVLCRKVLQLYKAKLRGLPKVQYVFSFEMRTSADVLNYYLVFASQHPLGLEKMKEAMKRIDQNGSYCFSDASVNQPTLFRFDDPLYYGGLLFNRFQGRRASYSELRDYALNETPFLNPKSMLRELEKRGLIEVASRGARSRGTFNEQKLEYVQFKSGRRHGQKD